MCIRDRDSITNAKSIIEVGLDKLNPDPSFGSHFFQNLTTLRIGYFTITRKFHKKYIDWDWLKTKKTFKKTTAPIHPDPQCSSRDGWLRSSFGNCFCPSLPLELLCNTILTQIFIGSAVQGPSSAYPFATYTSLT